MGENYDSKLSTSYILSDCDIINIDMLIDQLHYFNDWYEVVQYTVTENFRRTGVKTYKILNLVGEKENGIVFFIDGEELMYEEDHMLKMFLIKSIKEVVQVWKQGSKKCSMIIEFQDGEILIEVNLI